jgi:exonuclease VII large subunit
VTDAAGALIRSIDALAVGDEVEVLVGDGTFRSTVKEMKGRES